MYNKRYAKQWIANHESRKDVFRTKHLEPLVKKTLQNLPTNARILDIGCGWGMVVQFLKKGQKYVGIDPTKAFFPYIKAKFPKKNITLIKGSLPYNIKVKEEFDCVICSMTLHCTKDLKGSLKTIFSKLKTHGKVYVIDFNDAAEKPLRNEIYCPIYEEDKFHVKGVSTLPSGVKVKSETFFHKEKMIEKEILKYGAFKKRYLGPLFVVYEATKQKD